MINKKILTGKNVSYKKLNYAHFFNGINSDYDENIMPITYSPNTYNFSFNNGALKTGLGINYLKLPISYDVSNIATREVNFNDEYEFKAGWLYRKDNGNRFGLEGVYYDNYIILQTVLGDFYVLDVCSDVNFLQKIEGINITETPTVLNYNLNSEDSILICSSEGMWVYSFSSHFANKIENAPSIGSMCLHYERLFATTKNDRYAVWFSDDLDPTNWNISLNEAGFIRFNNDKGVVNKVVSFNDYVYVFTDFGISKITAFASQTEFSVDQLFVSSGKIYGDSVCVCGNKILMLTQNGIYAFDGYSTSKLNLNIDSLLENSVNTFVASCYCNGKYYLACNLNFNDEKKVLCEQGSYYNNVLLELDLNTNTLNVLRGVDIRQLTALTDDKLNKVMAFYVEEGKSKFGELGNYGSIINKSLPKCWTSPLSDLGYPEKQKIIKTIFLKSDVPIHITIRTEYGVKKFMATPKNNLIKLNTLIKCKLMAVDFETDSKNVLISNPTVVVGLV